MSVWGLCLKREDSSTDIQDAAAKVSSFVIIRSSIAVFEVGNISRRHLQALGTACESDDVSLAGRYNSIVLKQGWVRRGGCWGADLAAANVTKVQSLASMHAPLPLHPSTQIYNIIIIVYISDKCGCNEVF